MTRELKLAMVIGFALLLLLAILVSDHFSAADLRQRTLLESSQPRRALEDAPPPSIRELPPAQELLAASGPAAIPAIPRPIDPPADPLRDASPEVRPLGETARADVPSRPIPPPPAPASSERIHRVAEGESLTRIAERFYGDRDLWKALAAYNTDRLPNPNLMKTGLVLRIPPKELLVGASAGSGAATVRDPLLRDPAPIRAARSHVVREGETLSEIAAATLGSSRRWPELVAANRDRISDPDRVIPGTELRIPVASAN